MSLIGAQLANRYEIVREIGRGGMGVVYLARDPYLERDVAIKVLTATATDERAQTRFRREALVVAKMDHPGIVSVYDVGSHEGDLFFVMPYVEGVQLRSLMRERALSLGDALAIGMQVAEALEYSHQRAVVHRDIKPENLIVHREEDGWLRVRITDFGLARAPRSHRLTVSGALIGTVAYLSPEQVACRDVSHRADLYALGVILYECLTGRAPFGGEVPSILYQIAHERPPAFAELGVEVEAELDQLVFECLAKDPEDRPARAAEVAQRLEGVLRALSSGERERPMYLEHRTLAYEHERTVSDFIGREPEMVAVVARLEAALAGTSQLVLIRGEEGIGKSRLLLEVESVARSRGFQVCRGRGSANPDAPQHQAFAEVVHDHLRQERERTGESGRRLEGLAGEVARLWPGLTSIEQAAPHGGEEAGREVPSTPGLVAELVERIGGGRPLAVLLDDLHRSPDSVRLLGFLLRRLTATPTVLVATHQWPIPGDATAVNELLTELRGDERFASVLLGAFDRADHRRFVAKLTGATELSDSMIERVYVATEGSPYLTSELVKSLLEHGISGDSGELGSAAQVVGGDLRDSIDRKLEELTEDLDEVLAAASVLGASFDFRDLEDLCGPSEALDDAVDRLVQGGLLREDRDSRSDRIRFVNGLLRDVVYDRLARRRRKRLHRRFAEALEARSSVHRSPRLIALVDHYLSGGVPEKAVDFALLLARRQIAAGELEEADASLATVISLFEDAATSSPPSQEAEARTLVAEVRAIAGATDAALHELERAHQLLVGSGSAPTQLLEVCRRAADTAWQRRRVDETRAWVDRGLACGSEGNESYERLLILAASLASLQGDEAGAADLLARAQAGEASAGEGSSTEVRGGQAVVGLTGTVRARRPVDIVFDQEAEVLANVYETLVESRDDGLVPHLAASWSVNETGQRFELTVRSNVSLHDGRKLTAEHVVAAFRQAVADPQSEMPPAFAALAWTEGANGGPAIEAIDERRFALTLRQPLPVYPALLTDPRAAVAVPCEGREDETVGTGPFRLAAATDDGRRVLLEPAATWWHGEPARLEALEFRAGFDASRLAEAIRRGEIDLAGDLQPHDLDEVLRDAELRRGLVESPRRNVYFMVFNRSSPAGHSEELRRALCGAIPVAELVRGSLGRFGQPAEGLVPPGVLGHDPSRRRRTLSRAQVLEQLQQAAPDGPLKVRVVVHPAVADRYGELLAAIYEVWRDVGVEVETRPVTADGFLAQTRRPTDEVDLVIARWGGWYDDPDAFTTELFHSQTGRLRALVASSELDGLAERARTESSEGIRVHLYRRIEQLLLDGNWVLPVLHDVDYRVGRPELRGLSLQPDPPFVSYERLARAAPAARPAQGRESTASTLPSVAASLRVGLGVTIDNLDPMEFLEATWQVVPAVYETLTRHGGSVAAVPWLASSIEVDQASRRVHIRLRERVRFHDGRPLTTRDVRAAFERLLRREASWSRWLLAPIRGAEALLEGRGDQLAGVHLHSDRDMVVELEQSVVTFPAILSAVPIVPEGSDPNAGSWQTGCLGTGPFRLRRFEPGRALELEANPYYWRDGFPRSEGVAFELGLSGDELAAALSSGRLHVGWGVSAGDMEALLNDRSLGVTWCEVPSLSTYFLACNCGSGPLAEESVRRKLASVVRSSGVVERVGRFGVPASGLIPPGLLGASAAWPTVTSAVPQSAEPIPLTVMILSVFEDSWPVFTDDLFAALEAAGFRINVVEETHDRAGALARWPVDLLLSRWVADYPDADSFVHGLLHSSQGDVGALCGSAEVDELIERGRETSDPARRHDLYRRIEREIAGQTRLIPLFHEQTYRLASAAVADPREALGQAAVAYEKLRLIGKGSSQG